MQSNGSVFSLYGYHSRLSRFPLFYIENELWEYREEYDRVHEKLMKIRNSEEFKKGIRIKKILGMKM